MSRPGEARKCWNLSRQEIALSVGDSDGQGGTERKGRRDLEDQSSLGVGNEIVSGCQEAGTVNVTVTGTVSRRFRAHSLEPH